MPRGRKENMKPCKTKEEAAARGRAGGIKSGIARRKNKSIAEALKAVIYERSEIDPTKLVIDDVVANVVAQMLVNPSARDLETISRILGELQNKVAVDADVRGEVKADVSIKPDLFKLPDE